MNSTLRFYDENAPRVAAEYDRIDYSTVIDRLLPLLPRGGRILDLGCGSGRDAARLISIGFDLTVLDGSAQMLRSAVAFHPELAGREICFSLPGRLPIAAARFHAVTSWAALMHLSRAELASAFEEIARILKPRGLFAYSTNTNRSGLDEEGNDPDGRHFTCLPAGEWAALHERAGFHTLEIEETDDLTGRPGIRWATFFTRKASRPPKDE